MEKRKCKLCNAPITGRSDKIFCSSNCKTEYHYKLRNATAKEVTEVNKILARNRSILLEIKGKNQVQKKVPRLVLDMKKFNFKYHTHITRNSKGKLYFYCYDIAWMEFSDNEVLIVKKKGSI